MKITAVRRILRENFGGATLPPWFDQLLLPLNQFIDLVTVALSGNLTLGTNIAGNVVTLTFTHGSALKINPQVKGKVIGVIPMQFAGQALDSWSWVTNSDGSINVTMNFVGGVTGSTAICTIFIVPENT